MAERKRGGLERVSPDRPAKEAATRRPAVARAAVARSGAARTSRLPELDRIIHERIRLGIVSALAAEESISFADLKRLLRTSDGNLSVHARKLEAAGYIACVKRFEGRVPRTDYRITHSGREALERYLEHLEALIRWSRGRR